MALLQSPMAAAKPAGKRPPKMSGLVIPQDYPRVGKADEDLTENVTSPKKKSGPPAVEKKSMNGFEALSDWMEKHQKTVASSDSDWDGDELPGGEPGLSEGVEVSKPQDGGSLVATGRLAGATSSAESPMAPPEAADEESLSLDDQDMEEEGKEEGATDSEATDIGNAEAVASGPSSHDSEGAAIGDTSWASKEATEHDSEGSEIGAEDVQTEVLSRKSLNSDWVRGNVYYGTGEDERIANILEKSEGFAVFPVTQLDNSTVLQKSAPCTVCKSLKPIMLSVCPDCGCDESMHFEKSGEYANFKNLPARRPQNHGKMLYLPNGINVDSEE